jgi:V8-like Glu-specific endopeptidase
MKTRLHLFSFALALCFTFIFTTIGFGQTAPLAYYIQSYQLESGYHDGSGVLGSSPVQVFTGVVELHDIPWLQLHFSDANLGKESYIIIKSLQDNMWQKLDAVSLKQWQYYSAFFNGSSVEINLFAAPMDRQVFINVDEVMVGEWFAGDPFYSICGPTDDRIHSNQPATARLLNVGCTAWIIPNGNFATAGHCLDGTSATIVEFNVPLSLPDGTLQHPGPEDQYSVDGTSKIFVNGGIGNDFGVFQVFPNSITGLMPKTAQNAYWSLVQDLGPDSIRITGYGVDDGTANQTQQTNVGPNAGSSGTTMRYVTDTEGGNSGSPIIDALTNYAVGVHTHGGCSSSGGNNNGTSTFNAAFWTAVEQGAAGCPVELPLNPNPPQGQSGVPLDLAELTWSNGVGAVSNELYFGTNPASLTLVQSGSLAISWTITGVTFVYGTTYYWQVIEIGDSCNTNGPVWNFKTIQDPNYNCLFTEDFEGGLTAWTVTNLGGTCNWSQYFPPYPNAYTLPCGAGCGGVLSADVDECGSGTTENTAAQIGPFDASLYQSGEIIFDQDFYILGADECYVEVSTNGGSTWTVVWSQTSGLRNTTETVDVSTQVALQSQVWIRWRSVQPTWDWWWTIDNVQFCVYDLIPVELTSFTAKASEGLVELSWITTTETNNQGFEIERASSSTTPVQEWEQVGYVAGFGTTTEPKSYSFIDSKLEAGTYSYRLKQIDFDGTFTYSSEVNTDVELPLEYVLEQNYPNPFNPSTKIKFVLPVETKVRLNVYNTLGQEVAEIFNGNLKEGYHEVVFDAGSLTSGIYFYRLEADKFVDVKKMIILK